METNHITKSKSTNDLLVQHDQLDSDFEFSSTTSSDSSPADRLFFNGRLLPHSFPLQSPLKIDTNSYTKSRSTSISRNSSCSSSSTASARTCSSDSNLVRSLNQKIPARVHNGGSQKWQFVIAMPVQVPKSESSTRKRMKKRVVLERRKKRNGVRLFGWKVFRWFVLFCKECHAIEPIKKHDFLEENLKARMGTERWGPVKVSPAVKRSENI